MACVKCGKPIPPRVGPGGKRKRCIQCAPPKSSSSVKLPSPGGVLAATSALLTSCDRIETPLGQAALVLAKRIDANEDSGTAMASMTKQLESTLVSATANAEEQTTTALDELRVRRDAKRA